MILELRNWPQGLLALCSVCLLGRPNQMRQRLIDVKGGDSYADEWSQCAPFLPSSLFVPRPHPPSLCCSALQVPLYAWLCHPFLCTEREPPYWEGPVLFTLGHSLFLHPKAGFPSGLLLHSGASFLRFYLHVVWTDTGKGALCWIALGLCDRDDLGNLWQSYDSRVTVSWLGFLYRKLLSDTTIYGIGHVFRNKSVSCNLLNPGFDFSSLSPADYT